MKTKVVDFAYPTSSHAKKFGFNSSGCYVVGIMPLDWSTPSKASKGFATRQEAIEYGKTLEAPWHPLWLRSCADLA